jgi:exopolyphosphatase / guanosine-5'-triphosphate,3'-diphosphate pyrophosphatase
MRIAVIDLGTNTFNLLIAEITGTKRYNIICSCKEPVKLGEGGINRRTITPEAWDRGIRAIGLLSVMIGELQVQKVFAFATSAIRSAENGLLFVEEIHERYNISVEIISGDREAELIYYGVRKAIPLGTEKHLILDIGGGSNELIIANEEQVFWKESFPLGMARLLETFKPSDPILEKEIQDVENYLENGLSGFFQAMLEHKPTTLIGASGSFDTFKALLTRESDLAETKYQRNPSFEINPERFLPLHRKLITSTHEERLRMKGMEVIRVEMIVIASIFVHFILKSFHFRKFLQSDFSLKEGALEQIIRKHLCPAEKC